MILALDFGLSNLDVVLHSGECVLKHWTLGSPLVVNGAGLAQLCEQLDITLTTIEVIAATGGRYRDLPDSFAGIPIQQVSEPSASRPSFQQTAPWLQRSVQHSKANPYCLLKQDIFLS